MQGSLYHLKDGRQHPSPPLSSFFPLWLGAYVHAVLDLHRLVGLRGRRVEGDGAQTPIVLLPLERRVQ